MPKCSNIFIYYFNIPRIGNGFVWTVSVMIGGYFADKDLVATTGHNGTIIFWWDVTVGDINTDVSIIVFSWNKLY